MQDVQAISLGSWCGVRGVIRELGLGSANFPFDWLRCSLDGVLDAIRDDFKDFLAYDRTINLCEREEPVSRDYLNDSSDESILPFKQIFVSWGHSFWHDDLHKAEEQTKYARRIGRFRKLRERKSKTPLLFVRAVNTTAELAGIHLLNDLLIAHFGDRAHLLVLVNHQVSQHIFVFEDRPSLMIHTLGRQHDHEGLHGMKPLYCEAMQAGVSILLGNNPASLRRYSSLPEFLLSLKPGNRLIEDVSLGEDLSQQWVHFPQCGRLPADDALALCEAVQFIHQSPRLDVRRSPYDGQLYCLEGFLGSCAPGWTPEEIRQYWQTECVPFPMAASAKAGNPQEPVDAVKLRERRDAPSTETSRILLSVAAAEWKEARELGDGKEMKLCERRGVPSTDTLCILLNDAVAGMREALEHDDGKKSKNCAKSQPLSLSIMDVRRNPDDGHIYTFDALVQTCALHWKLEEVAEFWERACLPFDIHKWRRLVNEEELLEQLRSVQVISLGAHCGLKHALISMGVNSATFPFDWLRTTLGSVVRALCSDFENFLDYKQALPQYARPRVLTDEELADDDHTPFEVVYVCEGHAHWHSICWDERVSRSFSRRTQRLLSLQQFHEENHGALLFVRAASSGEEVLEASTLLEVISDKFGCRAYLLLLLSGQPSFITVFVKDRPEIAIATLGAECNDNEQYGGVMPLYREAILEMLRYIQYGQYPKRHVEIACLEDLASMMGSTFSTNIDLCNDPLQRWSPRAGTKIPLPLYPQTAAGRVVGSAHIAFRRCRPDVGRMRAISLGSWAGVKIAINELGFNKANLPFDWLRTTLDGVLHALDTDFVGFTDYDGILSRRGKDDQLAQAFGIFCPPPLQDIYLGRGLSFWYDDLTQESEVQKYDRRFERLKQLRLDHCSLMFVRAVNGTGELRGALKLLDTLQKLFGMQRTSLLVLLGSQPSERLILFEENAELMLHTSTQVLDDGEDMLPRMLPIYTRAISGAQQFQSSREITHACVYFRCLTEFFADPRGLLDSVEFDDDLCKQFRPIPVSQQKSKAILSNDAAMLYEIIG